VGGGISATTLWTNPDATVNFGNRDVTLSQAYTNFDYLRISFDWSTSTGSSNQALIPKATLDISSSKCTFAFGLDTRNRWGYASSSTVIHFTQAYVRQSAAQTASSVYIIPTKIEGIKIN
jgi:hypothetical protein